MDPTKIQVIRDWPAPTTLTELRSFLGLANFYHSFVLGFSHITWPLSQVTKGGVKEIFFWSKTQQKAFAEFGSRNYAEDVELLLIFNIIYSRHIVFIIIFYFVKN